MVDSLAVTATLLALVEVVPAERRDLSDLIKHAGDAQLLVSGKFLPDSKRLQELSAYLLESVSPLRIAHWERVLGELGRERPAVEVTYVTDGRYPRPLFDAYDCPPVLFLDGRYEDRDTCALAIVGSRSADAVALDFARASAKACAGSGVTVVSGLAEGVDTAAHDAALAAGGRSIAVLPTGVRRSVFPPSNVDLARRISAQGCVMSPFPPDAPATPSSFVARNAVISGLAPISLVVDADYRSGSYTEAEHAMKQNRRVLLWSPALREFDWAQRFAREPGVSFVDTLDEVVAATADAVAARTQAL